MFDRCRGWRKKLSRYHDGTLPLKQWGALESHLARCEHCRRAADADKARLAVLQCHTGLLDDDAAQNFDAGVLAQLKSGSMAAAGATPERVGWRQMLRDGTLTSPFFMQLAGGGLVAASVTALCLLPALHSNGGRAHLPQDPFAENATSAARAGQLPVPLETLLNTPTPRAALLWSHPTQSRAKSGAPAPDRPAPVAPKPPTRSAPPTPTRSDLPKPETLG